MLRPTGNYILFLLFFLILKSFPGIAQEGFHCGGILGGHNSWLFNQDESDQENLQREFTPGGSSGLYISYYIESSIAVAAEFRLSYQGQKYLMDRRIEDLTSKVRLLYFKTPLMLEFRAPLGKKGYFKGHFGPYSAMLQGAFRYRMGDAVEAPGKKEWSEAYRSPVFGVMAGIAPGLRWGRGWGASFELRFSHDLFNAEEKGSSLVPNRRAETYNMTLGFLFHFRYALKDRGPTKSGGLL
ncbi:MAG: hypothetical protein ABEH38_05145 [Flavobacteriales bacterium]